MSFRNVLTTPASVHEGVRELQGEIIEVINSLDSKKWTQWCKEGTEAFDSLHEEEEEEEEDGEWIGIESDIEDRVFGFIMDRQNELERMLTTLKSDHLTQKSVTDEFSAIKAQIEGYKPPYVK